MRAHGGPRALSRVAVVGEADPPPLQAHGGPVLDDEFDDVVGQLVHARLRASEVKSPPGRAAPPGKGCGVTSFVEKNYFQLNEFLSILLRFRVRILSCFYLYLNI